MPSGGGTSTTVSKQELSPEQRQLLNYVLPMAEEYASKPLELFPGSTIAGPTPEQLAGREYLANTAVNTLDPLSQSSIDTARMFSEGGGAAGLGSAYNLANLTGAGGAGVNYALGDYLSGQGGRQFLESGALLNPATNPVLASQTEAALRPITENLTESILPGIRSDFVGGNMFGSSRQGIAEGRAIGDYLRTAGDVASNIQNNNFTQGLNAMASSLAGGRQAGTTAIGEALGAGQGGSGQLLNAALQGLSLTPDLAQLAYTPGMLLEAVGSMGQGDAQALLSEQANRFTTQQMLPIMQAQDIANLAFGFPEGPSTTTGTQQSAFDPSSLLGLFMLPFLL